MNLLSGGSNTIALNDSNTVLSFDILNNLSDIQLSDLKIISIGNGSEIGFNILLNNRYILNISPYAGFIFKDIPGQSFKIGGVINTQSLITNISDILMSLLNKGVPKIHDNNIQDIKFKFVVAEYDDNCDINICSSEPEITISQLLYAMKENNVKITRGYIELRH